MKAINSEKKKKNQNYESQVTDSERLIKSMDT